MDRASVARAGRFFVWLLRPCPLSLMTLVVVWEVLLCFSVAADSPTPEQEAAMYLEPWQTPVPADTPASVAAAPHRAQGGAR